MHWLSFVGVCAVGGLIQAGIAYPSLAGPKGWPVGAWAHSNGWSIWFGVAAIATAFAAWHVGGILALGLLLPCCFFIGFLMSLVFGKSIQMLSYLGLPVAVVAFFLTM